MLQFSNIFMNFFQQLVRLNIKIPKPRFVSTSHLFLDFRLNHFVDASSMSRSAFLVTKRALNLCDYLFKEFRLFNFKLTDNLSMFILLILISLNCHSFE